MVRHLAEPGRQSRSAIRARRQEQLLFLRRRSPLREPWCSSRERSRGFLYFQETELKCRYFGSQPPSVHLPRFRHLLTRDKCRIPQCSCVPKGPPIAANTLEVDGLRGRAMESCQFAFTRLGRFLANATTVRSLLSATKSGMWPRLYRKYLRAPGGWSCCNISGNIESEGDGRPFHSVMEAASLLGGGV